LHVAKFRAQPTRLPPTQEAEGIREPLDTKVFKDSVEWQEAPPLVQHPHRILLTTCCTNLMAASVEAPFVVLVASKAAGKVFEANCSIASLHASDAHKAVFLEASPRMVAKSGRGGGVPDPGAAL